MKKIALVLLILAVAAGSAFAFDIESFMDSIEPGDFLISPTVNLGTYSFSGMVIGITGAVDYALPIPVMVGAEVGVAFTTFSGGPTSIPILARVSWHPNFEIDSLDIYARFKLGYNVAFGSRSYYSDNASWGGGFSWGASTGARYFFSDSMGVFGELGWDRYGISVRGLNAWDSYWGWSWYIYTWFHAGVTFKLGG